MYASGFSKSGNQFIDAIPIAPSDINFLKPKRYITVFIVADITE